MGQNFLMNAGGILRAPNGDLKGMHVTGSLAPTVAFRGTGTVSLGSYSTG